MKRTIINIALSASLCLILALPTRAEVALPTQGPVPLSSPFAATVKPASPFDHITTAAIPSPLSSSGKVAVSSRLKQALAAIESKQFSQALTLRGKMPIGAAERQLINWLLITSASPEISSRQINAMMGELPDWPGEARLRSAFERAVARENHEPAQVIALLGSSKPHSVAGMVTLGNALAKSGKTSQARTLIKPWWHEQKLSKADEKFVLEKLNAAILSKDDHLLRMKRMLYDYRIDSAEHLSRPAEARSLYQAVSAVARQEKNAAQKLAQVDKSWVKDPLLAFARIQYLRRQGKYDEAAKHLLKIPKKEEAAIHPDAWWSERRALSREMLDLGKFKIAYQLASGHVATNPAQIVDAEFHAGWYALRFLGDAKTAHKHFAKIVEVSSGAISQARGFYWLGRTQEKLGKATEAQNYYARAARFTTAYYGQLAAAKLGQKNLNVPYFRPSDEERRQFAKGAAFQAIQLLTLAGDKARAEILARELGQSLTSPGKLALLAAWAEKQGNYYLSLKIGKAAAARGIDVGALSHPLGAISAKIPLSDKALAYAIARQESEFNPTAQSGAGARGLLQLMPKTAKSVANAKKISYSLEKLSADASYNATLGSHFLMDQLERFQGSYILTFIGYNAGSGRVSDWISRYGDPRGQHVEMAVDWVERIPFTETRNYVQRVMENYQIYQARLGGNSDIARDMTRGR